MARGPKVLRYPPRAAPGVWIENRQWELIALNLAPEVPMEHDGFDEAFIERERQLPEQPEERWRDEERVEEPEPDPPHLNFNERFRSRAQDAPALPENVKTELPDGKLESTRLTLPSLSINYDQIEEINLRLRDCLILAKGLPYLVYTVVPAKKAFDIYLNDGEFMYRTPFSPEINLRSIEPGYISNNGEAYYMYRVPGKVYKQGLNQQNTMIARCGAGGSPIRPQVLLPALRNRKDRRWNNTLEILFHEGALKSLRMSNSVAVYRKEDRKNPSVEYRGRKLGILIDGRVDAEETDREMSWIYKDLHHVNLELRK